MRMHPLVTVKKAASILGVGKEIIRDKLMTGELKGEIRRIGLKDKWFVYSGEVDFLLENQRLPELEAKTDRISTQGMNEFFDTAQVESCESDTTDSAAHSGTSDHLLPAQPDAITWEVQTDQFEGALELLTKQFSLRILEQHHKMEEFKQSYMTHVDLSKEVGVLQEKLAQQERINKELTEEIRRLRNPFKNFFSIFGSNA